MRVNSGTGREGDGPARAGKPDRGRRAPTPLDANRGKKRGALPIDQATRYGFIVDLKAAKGLDLEIPSRLLYACSREVGVGAQRAVSPVGCQTDVPPW
jgi:hypothetical protein